MLIDIEEVQRVVRRQLGVKRVQADDHLQEDLGAESLDVQGIITALEDRFGVALEDEELESLETVRDIHALVSSKI